MDWFLMVLSHRVSNTEFFFDVVGCLSDEIVLNKKKKKRTEKNEWGWTDPCIGFRIENYE